MINGFFVPTYATGFKNLLPQKLHIFVVACNQQTDEIDEIR
jgi:hypothetical protein